MSKPLPPIASTILRAIHAHHPCPMPWEDIRAAVSEVHAIPPKGWLQVRGEIQYLINGGAIIRTSDIHTEAYILTPTMIAVLPILPR